ncbi:MAG: DUF362 domain-containing protein [archaeon]
MAIVGVIRCKSYSDVKSAVKKALDAIGGLEKFVKSNYKVLLKPNICDPLLPEKCATTHPFFVKAVIELVKEITPNIAVGEQAASCESGNTLKAAKISGILAVCKSTGVNFLNLQEEGFTPKKIPNHYVLEKTDFCKAIFEYDLIINLPKFKTHQLTLITGAIKNTFGLIHPDERHYLHKNFTKIDDFSKGIVDVYSFVLPGLTIMDAVNCMEGNEGPSYGKPVLVGCVIAGIDGVAVDSVAAKITGFNPENIPIIKYAAEKGIGIRDASAIQIAGDGISTVNFEKTSKYCDKKSKLAPFIGVRCKKCGACYKNCPAKAIESIEGKYVISKDKCIKCYCCMEVCVHEAVELRKSTITQNNTPINRKIANLRLGLTCNQKCLFCTVANDNEKTLTTIEAKNKISELATSSVKEICFTGGEPTIRKDLVELFLFAKEKGIQTISLQTNGSVISDFEYLKKLKAAGLTSVLIALHSNKKEVSDMLTDSSMFDESVAGIKNVVKLNIITSVSHVINKENYKFLIDYAKLIYSISDKIHLYFGFIRPNGRALDNKHLVPKLSEIELNLHNAMVFCKENFVSFSVEGIPLCYMQELISYCAETQRMKKEPQVYVGSDESRHENLHDFIHSNLKSKSKDCQICKLNSMCAGVWREYAKIYGTDELYPVFEKRGIN